MGLGCGGVVKRGECGRRRETRPGVVWCWNVELKGVVHGECSISCCIFVVMYS